MDTRHQDYFRTEVYHDWLTEIGPSSNPNTFWVAQHASIAEDQEPLTSPVIDCWYFDGGAFARRPTTDVATFLNVGADSAATSGTFNIGFGGFAPLSSSAEVILYWQFGGLHGAGFRYSPDTDRGFTRQLVWRS